MTVYIALILVMLFVSVLGHETIVDVRSKRVLLLFSLLVTAFISAVRFGIGGDYEHYVNEFNSIEKLGSKASYTEIGYSSLSSLLSSLNLPPQSIFIVSSAMLAIAIYYFVVHNIEPCYWGLFVLLYVIFGFFFSSMNILRQYMATAFCIVAFCYLSKRRYLGFWIFLVFGMLFHTAAIFCALVPLIMHFVRSRNSLLIVFAAYLLSFTGLIIDIRPMVIPLLSAIPRWSGYANSDFFSDRNSNAILKVILPNACFLWYFFVIQKSLGRKQSNFETVRANPLDSLAINKVYVIGTLCYLFFQNLFYGVIVATRISELFFVLYLGFIIELMRTFKEPQVKVMYTLTIVIYGIFLTIVTIFIMNGNGVMPYSSIFTS